MKKHLLFKTFNLQTHTFWFVVTLLIVSAIFPSCEKVDWKSFNKQDKKQTSPEMVMKWNEAATIAVAQMGSGPDALPPMIESRIYAMVNLAMHDALNSIEGVYQRYAFLGSREKNASPDAAVAQAAHDVIVAQLPPQKTYADNLLAESLASVQGTGPRDKGIELGKKVALAILDKRANDGSDIAQFPLAGGIEPGEYRATFPFDGPPFNGLIALPGWGKVTPFGLTKGSQFRAVPPPALNSDEYAGNLNEIKSLGVGTGSGRSTDQSEIAIFWLENSPLGWNRIARTIFQKASLDAWACARLFALLQMAEADAYIGSFDSKYHYFFWRPQTAIRLADNDLNPNTSGVPDWMEYAFPCPPVPDYTSAHACAGGAGAEMIKRFFNFDNIPFSQTSTSLPGVTRKFKSLSEAARENALSRIYAGYHFRFAIDAGEKQGREIGKYIFEQYLKPE
jgi:hypothetical protein